MSRCVTAVRTIGGVTLQKMLELPIEPVVGQWVEIEGGKALAVESVWLRPLPSPWAPGVKTPSVSIQFGPEPVVHDSGRLELALAAGWRDKASPEFCAEQRDGR